MAHNALLLLTAVFLSFCHFSCLGKSKARVWEGTITVKTNDEFLQNPIPQIADAEKRHVYPYALHKFIDYRLKPKVFRAVFLENEYLKVTILPELGGHVYSAVDKKSGNEMFWANPELKKALIGSTGMWSAFGLEVNFPLRGHTPTSLLPVDVALRQEGNSAATAILNDREYIGDMRWTAEITLREKNPRLEITMRLYNPTPLPKPLYYWSNAAVMANDSLQVVFPQPRSSTHGSPWIRSWPVEEDGTDLSWYKNHVGYQYSRFNRDDTENFMGYYDFSRRFGAFHWADRDVLPFRKFWSWGLSPVGRNWNKRLSDSGGEYIEMQAGLFKDQETMGFLMPHENVTFTEYWVPVSKCGAFSAASLDAALGLRVDSGAGGNPKVVFGFSAFRDFGKGKIELKGGDSVIASHRIDIATGSSDEFVFQGPGMKSPYTVALSDGKGSEILSYTHGVYGKTEEFKPGPLSYPDSLDRPVTAEDFYQAALEKELLYDLEPSKKLIEEGLAKYPNSGVLNKAQVRLLLVSGQPALALDKLRSMQHRYFSDPELDYLKALGLFETGEVSQALHHFSLAKRLSFAPASCLYYIGLCDLQQGRPDRALRSFQEANKFSPGDRLSKAAEIWIYAKAGRSTQAKDMAKALLKEDPAAYSVTPFTGAVGPRDEFKQWQFAASDLFDLMEYKAAGNLLEVSGKFNDDPMLHYTQAFLLAKQGLDPEPALKRARACSVEHVMPHTLFDLKVLEFACQKDPRDPAAGYLLGLLYLSKQRVDDAVARLDAAAVLSGHSPVCHVARYLAYREQGWPPSGLEAPLKEALKEKPDLQYAAMELNGLYVKRNVPSGERLNHLLEAARAAGPNVSEELERTVIMTLIEKGDLQGAATKMGEREYHTWEGGSGMRPAWWNTQLMRARRLMREKRHGEALEMVALSMEFPENLFAEESNFGLEGFETYYWKGRVLKALGEKQGAEAAFKASSEWKPFVAGNAGGERRRLTYHRLFAALSLKELGKKEEAAALLNEFSALQRKGRMDPLAETLYLHIAGQEKAAKARAGAGLRDLPLDTERLLILEYLSGNLLL